MELNLRILKILVFFLVSISFIMLSSKVVKAEVETYSVFAKLPLLGEVEVQKIKTNFTTIDDKIKYSYYVSPTKIVDFFDDKISSGFISGKLENNNIVTEEYFFKTEKEDFKREIYFQYLDGLIEEVNIKPSYDISKISKVSDIMIKESIDPVSMFYLITDFEYIKNCNKIIKVYDGKRRYDLILSKPIKNDLSYSCTLTHQKIAGYKPDKIAENKLYVSDLIFLVNDKQSYKFSEVSLRNNNTELIIRKN
tara:strand:- start:1132 stop:1884 length:753 start_codon:yes stop_codon:yes gene_type:complete